MLLNYHQKQIINLLRDGKTHDQIASTLNISKPKVKATLTELFKLTNTTNAPNLINYAWENNLLPLNDFTNRSIKVDGPKQFK